MITSSASPSSAETPIGSLRGAGPVTAARLAERGIATARDLLLRLPRGYDDLRRATPIGALAEVADGTVVLVRGRVRRLHLFPRRLLDVFLEDEAPAGDGAVVRARWFRAHASMAKAFPKGSVIALAGPLHTAPDGTRELIHPANVTAALAAAGGGGLGFRPRYAAIEGVKGRTLEVLRAGALARLADDGSELLPAATRARLGLPPVAEALRRLHAPGDEALAGDAVPRARQRIVLEQLLVAQLAFLLRRGAAGVPAVRVPAAVAAAAIARLTAALPFALTPSQARAVAALATDLAGASAMQRLLVGDVGSGKTVVALAAAALVGAAGGQTLMMVPTEVLAEQQARALTPLAAACGLPLAVLTGSVRAAARAAILAEAAAGRTALLIGTQALLSGDVALPRLGLVIVDEQHRFGVAQRARLGKGNGLGAAHLLAMSATPIPRSLALARHGDLDLTTLTERPSGRAPAAAVLCASADERRAAYARLQDAVADGRQGFVVCPVRDSRPGRTSSARPSAAREVDAGTRTGAVAHHARLAKALAPARVGLLHGALPAAKKDAVLRAFAAGELDVLVATTVVELGIDVGNATVMIVEEAERFGLAQLHQLRGRVGRGAHPGICFLCAGEETSADASARLAVLAGTSDGFALAEADLVQRGHGDLFGTAQWGTDDDVLAETLAPAGRGRSLLETARAEAEQLLADDPTLARGEHAALAAAARARLGTSFASDAG